MNIAQEELDAWARFCVVTRRGMAKMDALLRAGQVEEARRMIADCGAASGRMARRMEQSGAQLPPDYPSAPEVPLSAMTSEANKRFARALREACEAARAVDRERGCDGDGPAEVLGDLLFFVEAEAFGPVGLRSE